MSNSDQAVPAADVLRTLDELEAEANARRTELRAIAAQLPAVMSRRALGRAVLVDLRRSPNKGAIARRGVSKVVRAPLHAAKRTQLKLRASRATGPT